MSLPAMPILLLSDRTATLILAAAGAAVNFYASYKLLTTWFSTRFTSAANEESEWEGLSWKLDSAKALGVILCAYFFVGGVASIVGVIGVTKRKTQHLRLFRDYTIADLAFAFASTTLFAYLSTKPVVRSMLCEELSRQPDLLRSLSDSAGLNVENCESFLRKAIVGSLIGLGVVLFIRLQFTLTVVNYYSHVRRLERHEEAVPLHHCSHSLPTSPSTPRRSRSRSHSRSHSGSQRILLLSQPLSAKDAKAGDDSTVIYAPVRFSLDQTKGMDVREAYISLPRIREEDVGSGRDEGKIRLPITEGEPLHGQRKD